MSQAKTRTAAPIALSAVVAVGVLASLATACSRLPPEFGAARPGPASLRSGSAFGLTPGMDIEQAHAKLADIQAHEAGAFCLEAASQDPLVQATGATCRTGHEQEIFHISPLLGPHGTIALIRRDDKVEQVSCLSVAAR